MPGRSPARRRRSDADEGGCSGAESFALRVLGDEMAPEFNAGEIIIVEPDGALQDGSFVLAQLAGEWIFRQLCAAATAGCCTRSTRRSPSWPTCRCPTWRRCAASSSRRPCPDGAG